MRLEIIVPDSTKPELMDRLSTLVKRLNESPELVNRISLENDEVVQRMFTPERLASIAAAEAAIDKGEFLTISQVEDGLAKNKSKWHSANQS